MKKVLIKVAEEFSPTPGGRYMSDGPWSAEKLREELLIPALVNNQLVAVDLDGGYGYAASFLEEAFGGLVRKGVAVDKLVFISQDEPLIDEICGYISDAEERL